MKTAEEILRAHGCIPIAEDVRLMALEVRGFRQDADDLEAKGFDPNIVQQIREVAAAVEQQLSRALRSRAEREAAARNPVPTMPGGA